MRKPEQSTPSPAHIKATVKANQLIEEANRVLRSHDDLSEGRAKAYWRQRGHQGILGKPCCQDCSDYYDVLIRSRS